MNIFNKGETVEYIKSGEIFKVIDFVCFSFIRGHYKYEIEHLNNPVFKIWVDESELRAIVTQTVKPKFIVTELVYLSGFGSDVFEIMHVDSTRNPTQYTLECRKTRNLYYAEENELTGMNGTPTVRTGLTSGVGVIPSGTITVNNTWTGYTPTFTLPQGYTIDQDKLNFGFVAPKKLDAPKCTCGAIKCNSNMHSTWCDLNEKVG